MLNINGRDAPLGFPRVFRSMSCRMMVVQEQVQGEGSNINCRLGSPSDMERTYRSSLCIRLLLPHIMCMSEMTSNEFAGGAFVLLHHHGFLPEPHFLGTGSVNDFRFSNENKTQTS